jgi:hypothetical protein
MANITQPERKESKAASWRALFLLLGLAVLTALISQGCKSSSPASKDPGKN